MSLGDIDRHFRVRDKPYTVRVGIYVDIDLDAENDDEALEWARTIVHEENPDILEIEGIELDYDIISGPF